MAEKNYEKARNERSPDIRLTPRGSLRWPRTGRNNAKSHQWQPRTTNANANRRNKLGIVSINVGTMKGRANKSAETLERRRADICCLQETRRKCDGPELVKGKSGRFCMYWFGRDAKRKRRVAIYVAEKHKNAILTVERISSNIMTVRFKTSSRTLRITCVYAPQSGRKCKEKGEFYETSMLELSKDSADISMICGDMATWELETQTMKEFTEIMVMVSSTTRL